jgi:hypothetical protein
MKLTTIAAKIRMTAAEMEAGAALGKDPRYPPVVLESEGAQLIKLLAKGIERRQIAWKVLH